MPHAYEAIPAVAADERRRHIRVLVIHDEEIVHCGWRLLLSRQNWTARCLAAATPASAVQLARRYEPSVAILDLDVGHEQTAAAAAALRAACPALRILLMAGRASISPKAAQYLGAVGVVSKTLPAAELAEAVLAVASGRRLYAVTAPRSAGSLSARERQVLTLMSAGATNREIAADLNLSEETIKQHAAGIYRKLEVRNRTEAAQRSHQLGLTLVGA